MGLTTPELDKVLSPYIEKHYNHELEYQIKTLKRYTNGERLNDKQMEIAKEIAYEDTAKAVEQLIQGIEIELNVISSSRGDYPFTTISLGLQNDRWGKLFSSTYFKVRMKGQGEDKNIVCFPK